MATPEREPRRGERRSILNVGPDLIIAALQLAETAPAILTQLKEINGGLSEINGQMELMRQDIQGLELHLQKLDRLDHVFDVMDDVYKDVERLAHPLRAIVGRTGDGHPRPGQP